MGRFASHLCTIPLLSVATCVCYQTELRAAHASTQQLGTLLDTERARSAGLAQQLKQALDEIRHQREARHAAIAGIV